MFEQQISRLRRSLGRDDTQQRSRWLAPLAIAAAGMTGLVALVASRLRRQPTAEGTSARARTTSAGSESAERQSPTTEGGAQPAKPRTRRSRKASTAEDSAARRSTTAARARKETSSAGQKKAPTRTRNTAA